MRITYLDVTSVKSGFVSLNASSHPVLDCFYREILASLLLATVRVCVPQPPVALPVVEHGGGGGVSLVFVVVVV